MRLDMRFVVLIALISGLAITNTAFAENQEDAITLTPENEIASSPINTAMPAAASSNSSVSVKVEATTDSAKSALTAVNATRSIFYRLPATGHAATTISGGTISRKTSVVSNAWSYDPDTGAWTNTGNTAAINNTDSTEFNLNYTYGFAERSYFSFDMGYVKSSFQPENGPATSAAGLKDFGFAFTRLSPSRNIIYGAAANLSPGKARPAGAWAVGNNFSGGHMLSPFIGFETRATGAVMGTKFTVNIGIDRGSDSSQNLLLSRYGTSFVDLTGFYEFPIVKNVNLGTALTFIGTESIVSGSMNDLTYLAKAYASGKITEDTEADVAVSGASIQGTSSNAAETRISLGLRKTL